MGIRDALAALIGANPTYQNITYGDDFRSRVLGMSVEDLWRTQPYLRTVVTFLARNIAQLGLHSFQRISDTDRQRLRDDSLPRLLASPNPDSTTYELVFALVADLALYDEALWILVESSDSNSGWQIRSLSPSWVTRRGGGSVFAPAWIEFTAPGVFAPVRVPMEQVIWFHGWNPGSPASSSSPVEALKQILAEQIYAQNFRQQVWQKGGRIGGVLSRPVGAKWDKDTREKFQRSWQAKYSGNDGAAAGGTPILEDGMTYDRVGFNAHEEEYIDGAKLALNTVASVYHVNPTMIGLLDNANFSNVREFRKMLYGDTLGSTISMIEDRVNAFVVPRVTTTADVYVEFNIAEKLQGSFEEQAAALSSATGAPYLTRNEARATQNKPALPGGDDLVVPLNVLIGGQSSAHDSGSQNETGKSAWKHIDLSIGKIPRLAKGGVIAVAPGGHLAVVGDEYAVPLKGHLKADAAPESYQAKAAEVLRSFFRKQRASVLSRLGAKDPGWWDADRWDSELSDDLYALSVTTATELGRAKATELGFESGDYDEDRTLKFLRAVANSRAGAVNSTTRDRIKEALDAGDEPATVFDEAEDTRSTSGGTALMAALAGFAVTEVAKQLVGDTATKTWETGANPRAEHASMNGETVGINDVFSNGADWPGDPVLGAEGNSNCNCGVSVNF